MTPLWHFALLLGWIGLLAFFFANVEIHIEGDAGWAANLPTWRIEEHWLLDVFWGSRPMTGYHAWMFSFMTLAFHLPIFLFGTWTLAIEARIFASLMYFWMLEDFLWFVLNPAYGLAKFRRGAIPWHKHWLWCMPVDYVVFFVAGMGLFWYSFR